MYIPVLPFIAYDGNGCHEIAWCISASQAVQDR